jgi:ketosteroid isomerase-like protein
VARRAALQRKRQRETSARNVALVRESFDALNRGDAEWLAERSAADVEVHGRGFAGEPVVYRGAAGIREYFRDMAESLGSVETIPEGVHDYGDRVGDVARAFAAV